MKPVDVIGKSREQIEKELNRAKYSRQDLLDLIYRLATWPPKFSPATIAAACEMTPRAIIARIKDRTIEGVYKPLDNGWRVSLPGLLKWDEQTAVKVAEHQR